MVTQFRNYMENLLLWFTDPEAAKRAWRERRTTALRTALAPQLSTDTFGWPIEQIIHDDVIDPIPADRAAITRRAYYGRAAYHSGARLQKRMRARNFVISIVSFLVVCATAYLLGRNGSSLAWQWGSTAAGACMVIAGIYLFGCARGLTADSWRLILPAGPLLTEEEIEDVKEFGARVLLRVTPPQTPSDLVGSYRAWTYDRDGNPVDGQIVPDDLSVSYLRKAAVDESVPMAVAGIAFSMAGAFVATDSISWFFAPIVAGAAAVWSLLSIFDLSSIAKTRAAAAREALAVSAYPKLIEQEGKSKFSDFDRALDEQIKRAISEQSPFIQLGISTDLFAERRDPFSPAKAGVPFGMTVADLSTHLLIVGLTGTGKTAACIRPVVWQWQAAKAGGLLVLDGKGQLPTELVDLPGFQVISPGNASFNAIQNLRPDEVADTLFKLFSSDKGNAGDVSGNEWEQFARELLRSAAKVLALLNALEPTEWPWTLGSIYALAFEPGSRERAKVIIEEGSACGHLMPGHVRRAYNGFMVRHIEKADETRSSIELNLETWLGTLINDQDLGAWADTEEGIEIEDCLYGAMLGLALPDTQTGVAISALAKRRFYSAIKRRGDGWKADGQTAVLLVVDEAQDLVSHEELAILPKARSLGLCAVYSTQGLDGLQVALKDEQATIMLLDQFRSIVSAQIGSDMTLAYVSKRIGASPRVVFSEVAANSTDPVAMANSYGVNAGGYSAGTLAARAQTSDEMLKLSRSYGHVGQAIQTMSELAKKFGAEQAWQQLPAVIRRERPAGSVKIGEIPLVAVEEIHSLTMNKFTALAAINRCGTIRRSQIRLIPMFQFPTEEKAA
ncbi:TraM recognition domain-containing protein [Pseudomonas sp. SG20052]|uniref:TraM recognition domain-containing protein n=1 Tax=Pseudomonas sp. SG20052 TaxID=3074147 RepID=UPI00287F5969|nr:TraM recognition domain-containing protein [Pseudomonas sp. SG20052]WNF54229.1 TraM recognition domain-containing protein [Pseudomonas sp. SG20052]